LHWLVFVGMHLALAPVFLYIGKIIPDTNNK
jgi:hypothetical protein